jgi:hypothetical protein
MKNTQTLSVKQKLRNAVNDAQKQAPSLHYIGVYMCINCGAYNVLTIPCGTRVIDYARNVDCINCQCKLIHEEDTL